MLHVIVGKKLKNHIADGKRFKIVQGTIYCFIVYNFWYIILKENEERQKNSFHPLKKIQYYNQNWDKNATFIRLVKQNFKMNAEKDTKYVRGNKIPCRINP